MGSKVFLFSILSLFSTLVYAQVGQNIFKGGWELVSQSSGVSAMHNILLPNTNKILMFDSTVWKISKLPLPPQKLPCRIADPVRRIQDCFTHSVFFDYVTHEITAVKVDTDTWCSSGGLSVDGAIVSTGGYQSGVKAVRYLTCPTCDWKEYPPALADPRWYGTQVSLPDGSFLVFGGRDAFSYELVPREGQNNRASIFLPLFRETTDSFFTGRQPNPNFRLENNLYPFVHLVPDGNVFVFANNRSILIDPVTNKVIKEYPVMPGGSRNYPASGMSVILPINPATANKNFEVMVCGGGRWDSYFFSQIQGKFFPALQDCGRINLMEPNPVWRKEDMPTPRTMGDMRLLPNGEILFINGAKAGTSAWLCADEPNFTPVLYKPDGPVGFRFRELAPSTIPRMYHSTSELLPDGTILVAGSNTNDGYIFNVKFPTELRVEKFSPPYLNPALAAQKQEIVGADKAIAYGRNFNVQVKAKGLLNKNEVQVTMYAPAFNTHGVAMNMRLIMANVLNVISNSAPGIHTITVAAPPSGKIAPPGYYMLFVVYEGVPSSSIWVQIK